MIRIALFGYAGSGKTTLFRMFTGKTDEVYDPFQPNVAVARFPDSRLTRITEILQYKKTVYPEFEFLDLKGFPEGAGFPPDYFSSLLEVDLILVVAGNFQPRANPEEEAASLAMELLFYDQERMERILASREKAEKDGQTHSPEQQKVLVKALEHLKKERMLADLPDEEKRQLAGLELLTLKRILVLVNGRAQACRTAPNFFQADMANFPLEQFFLKIKETLGLVEFYTVKGDICQGWLIPTSLEAKSAAGKIHKDIEKGFIKAAVLPYRDLLEIGDWQKAKNQGVLKFLGPHSLISDGDVVEFYFHH